MPLAGYFNRIYAGIVIALRCVWRSNRGGWVLYNILCYSTVSADGIQQDRPPPYAILAAGIQLPVFMS